MTTQKAKWPVSLMIVGAIAVYLHAHSPLAPQPTAVTMQQGTAVEVRLDRAVSSKTSASGERFTGKLAKPILINGRVTVPEGTEFLGKVIQAAPAGHLAGGASLRIALTSFSMGDREYAVQSTSIFRVSEGKGKRTAELTGGGAVLGAAIGALAHGGKGALIGAAVGAGAGAVGSAATGKARDIVLPAESLLTFKLTQSVVITPKPAPQPPQTDVSAMIRRLLS
jgi:hypothetical protein